MSVKGLAAYIGCELLGVAVYSSLLLVYRAVLRTAGVSSSVLQ